MKTIMHPDYWVEIPAGECIIGMSMEQREIIWAKLLELAHYDRRPRHEQVMMERAIDKYRRKEKLSPQEEEVFRIEPSTIHNADLWFVPDQQTVWLDRFYITRFPLTDDQFTMFGRREVVSARNLPGMLDTPETERRKDGSLLYCRCKGATAGAGEELCSQLGARFPTSNEWEKAARGTDGRLYPWGNEWNPNAGYFYRQQKYPRTCWDGQTEVNAHPEGVSPYGVWAMMGGLPELVTTIIKDRPEKSTRGWHPKNTKSESAFIAYLAASRGISVDPTPTALRPVLNQWPVQQWQGVNLDEG